jgi:hypothetical protein
MINGTQYDLEMQIFSTDPLNLHLICRTGGVISVLFKVDDTKPNSFFDWQAAATAGGDVNIDISLLLSRVAGSTTTVTGYIGTDSMPPCTSSTCWYVVNQPFYIS